MKTSKDLSFVIKFTEWVNSIFKCSNTDKFKFKFSNIYGDLCGAILTCEFDKNDETDCHIPHFRYITGAKIDCILGFLGTSVKFAIDTYWNTMNIMYRLAPSNSNQVVYSLVKDLPKYLNENKDKIKNEYNNFFKSEIRLSSVSLFPIIDGLKKILNKFVIDPRNIINDQTYHISNTIVCNKDCSKVIQAIKYKFKLCGDCTYSVESTPVKVKIVSDCGQTVFGVELLDGDSGSTIGENAGEIHFNVFIGKYSAETGCGEFVYYDTELLPGNKIENKFWHKLIKCYEERIRVLRNLDGKYTDKLIEILKHN